MISVLIYIVSVLLSALAAQGLYLALSRGMARNAVRLQARRFLIASALSLLPMALNGLPWRSGPVLMALLTALAWSVTYPLLYHWSNRKGAVSYEHQMDIVAGIYCFGLLTALLSLFSLLPMAILWLSLLALMEIALLCIPICLWGYYFLYHICINSYGIQIIQDTNYNEIIEFFHSLTPRRVFLLAATVLVLPLVCFSLNLAPTGSRTELSLPIVAAEIVLLVVYGIYLGKRKHGVAVRTGAINLWLLVKEYRKENQNYARECRKRMKDLTVEAVGAPCSHPSTFLMVIGESASRDYMSAFAPTDVETTPWLDRCKADKEHFILFPHAYSCNMHTVPTLQKALTECNQYNGKPFLSSPSVIDIAHKLGYKVHWYSNQGHLGAFDTPITTIADTADVDKWTKQTLGHVQYDERLMDFLGELDPKENNLLVLHLKGSHFNYQNRFPPEKRMWGKECPTDNYLNYKNSLHYTDSILQQCYDYCRQHLNLQFMLYFSDHAADPGKPRFPGFNGFAPGRIPLFVYVSDEYKQLHPERVAALRENRSKYFTNDLAYELMCGLFDIRSNHFDESGCLASSSYRFTRETLYTYEGKVRIADDDGECLLDEFKS